MSTRTSAEIFGQIIQGVYDSWQATNSYVEGNDFTQPRNSDGKMWLFRVPADLTSGATWNQVEEDRYTPVSEYVPPEMVSTYTATTSGQQLIIPATDDAPIKYMIYQAPAPINMDIILKNRVGNDTLVFGGFQPGAGYRVLDDDGVTVLAEDIVLNEVFTAVNPSGTKWLIHREEGGGTKVLKATFKIPNSEFNDSFTEAATLINTEAPNGGDVTTSYFLVEYSIGNWGVRKFYNNTVVDGRFLPVSTLDSAAELEGVFIAVEQGSEKGLWYIKGGVLTEVVVIPPSTGSAPEVSNYDVANAGDSVTIPATDLAKVKVINYTGSGAIDANVIMDDRIGSHLLFFTATSGTGEYKIYQQDGTTLIVDGVQRGEILRFVNTNGTSWAVDRDLYKTRGGTPLFEVEHIVTNAEFTGGLTGDALTQAQAEAPNANDITTSDFLVEMSPNVWNILPLQYTGAPGLYAPSAQTDFLKEQFGALVLVSGTGQGLYKLEKDTLTLLVDATPVTVDSALNGTSTNPVENQVIEASQAAQDIVINSNTGLISTNVSAVLTVNTKATTNATAIGVNTSHRTNVSNPHSITATQSSVIATGFDGNLDTNDDNVQKVAQKLDDLLIPDIQTIFISPGADFTAAFNSTNIIGTENITLPLIAESSGTQFAVKFVMADGSDWADRTTANWITTDAATIANGVPAEGTVPLTFYLVGQKWVPRF